MADITLSGHEYRTGKLTPKQQLHLARRLAPLISGIGPLLSALSAGELDDAVDSLKQLEPFALALARMTDEEVDAIIDPCLMVAHRKVNASYAPLMPSRGALMFSDLSMQDMVQITFTVIQENLLDFSPGQAAGGPAPSLRAVGRS